MRRTRKVKILATLGPSSRDAATIGALFRAGADNFRINMSHTDHDEMRRLVRVIRDLEAAENRPIGVLIDLQGPKLRVGRFAEGKVALEVGQSFTLDGDEAPGDTSRVHLPHPDIFEAVEPGHAVLLDDGRVRLEVTEAEPRRLTTRVLAGRALSDRKGVSLPDSTLRSSSLTDKDRRDLEAALNESVDWIALSFIQRPEDVAEAKKIAGSRAAILAKIEKPQAVAHLDGILELADAIMVARGDLGVEMPLEKLPGIQKQLTRAARKAGKPVVVATQMLESMISAPVPTRAEVSDVAAAVFEGADAIMLSAESASGQYPVEAVTTMNDIATAVECDMYYPGIINAQRPQSEQTGADAMTAAARQIAEQLNLSAIVCFTLSGSTGSRASRERPLVPIIALSPIVHTARRLSLAWGLHSVVTHDVHDTDEMVDRASAAALKEGFAKEGGRIIIIAGVPFGTKGSTNLVRLAFVSGPRE